MKKKWLGFLTAAFALTAAFGFAACNDKDSGKGDSGKGEKTQIEQIYDQYVIYAEAKGQEPLSYEQWLETIKGEDGVGIASVTVNEDGALVITFTDGTSQTVDMPADDTVTESLRYQKISGKDEYRVMGMGTVSDLDVVIPATYRGLPVTEIGMNAFQNETYVTSVKIPDSVTTIGNSAFNNCESLTSVTMPNSVTSVGDAAFGGCDSLTSVTIPDGVTAIGDSAFYNCESLTNVTIGNGVTTIGESAFSNCESLTSVTIPDSVTTIGDYAFSSCENLTSVTIGDSVTSIGNSAFSFCYRLVEVCNKSSLEITVGSSENGYVGYYALNVYTPTNGVSKLSTDNSGYIIYTDGDDKLLVGYTGSETALTLPSGITGINKYAFYNCDSLTSVTIPDSVTSIGSRAFEYCSSLTSVTIGDSVTTIGDYAFRDCRGLTSVTMGDSVTSIGNYAFAYCESLTSVTIGDSVTKIFFNAFYDCESLTSITFEGTIDEWKAIEKGSYWNYNVPAEKVVCKDGEGSI